MSDENTNNEKLFTQKEVLAMFSKSLAVNAKELADKAEGIDLSTTSSMTSFLTEAGVEKRNQEFNKGAIKAAKKKEALIREIFPDVDFNGMQVEDMLIHMRDDVFKKSKDTDTKNKQITLEQALEVPAIKKVWENLREQANSKESLQKEFEAFKKVSKLSGLAISKLEAEGAQFSQDARRRQRQIDLINKELENLNFKFDEDGNPIILDSDGLPKRNLQTGDDYSFTDFLRSVSPVDFKAKEEEAPKAKNTPMPSDPKGNNGGTYGFTKEEISKLSIADFSKAKQEGLADKANFIRAQITKNVENKD